MQLEFMPSYKPNNSGSTLLMALLVLAIVTASVFVVSTITLRTIKLMAGAQTGEVAILGADAALEDGVWAHVRHQLSYVGDCDVSPEVYHTDNLSGDLSAEVIESCRSRLLANPYTFNIDANQSKTIYIADYDDVSANPGYAQITFTNATTGGPSTGRIKVCSWDTANCADGGTVGDVADFNLVNPGDTRSVALSATRKYVLVLLGGFASSLRVTTQSFQGGPGNLNPKGLPSDTVIIRANGHDTNAQRREEININP